MTRDLSTLSDEELFSMAGVQPSQQPDISNLSDEELFSLAEQKPTEEGNFLSRFASGVGEFAKGAVSGVENIGLGILQTAADFGADFDGAKAILTRIRPDLAEELGQITSEDVSRSIGRITGRKKEQERPGAFRAGEFVGEVTPFLPVGAQAGLVKGGAIAGGAISGLAPLEEPGLPERAKETAIGAGLGAATGGVLKGVGVGARATGRGIKRLTVATKAEDVLAARLPEGQTSQLLEQLKTATPDSPVTLPDIAGDEVQGLTRSVGKLSGGAKDIISEALEGRSNKAVERVTNQLSKDISDVDTYFASLDDIAKARSKVAAPFYEKAFAKKTQLDPKKDAELLRKIAPDIADARKKFRLGPEIKDNSIVMLDNAKKSLDDKIGVAVRQGENQQARALTGIKRELVDKLDALNPDYKKARDIFSDFSSIETAQKEGVDFLKRTPEELKRRFKDFSPSEKEAYRIGVRESLQNLVSKTPEGADPAKRIFGNSLKRNQLKAIFKDEKSFNSFKNRMEEEIAAAETKFKVLGGSRTDINLANDAQFIDEVVRGGEVLTGSKVALINAVSTSLKNRAAGLSKRNSKQLARILVDKKEGIAALESILRKEQSGVQKRVIGDFIESIRPALLASQGIKQTLEE